MAQARSDRYGGQGDFVQGQDRYNGGGYNQSSNPYANTEMQTFTTPSQRPSVMSDQDFLDHVDGVRKQIESLSPQLTLIASAHQRSLSSRDGNASSQVEHLVSQTQIINTHIKDQIKVLEEDSARSAGNVAKASQIRNLKNQFRNQLERYRREELSFKKGYQEQIARQYRIVNPLASDEEVREASEANWGDAGVFETALRSNRSGAATSVLGAVRARHNDIQQIEKTLIELDQLFQDLSQTVLVHEAAVTSVEQRTDNIVKETTSANAELTKGVSNARRARKLRWCCLILLLLILGAITIVLVIKFKPKSNPPKDKPDPNKPT